MKRGWLGGALLGLCLISTVCGQTLPAANESAPVHVGDLTFTARAEARLPMKATVDWKHPFVLQFRVRNDSKHVVIFPTFDTSYAYIRGADGKLNEGGFARTLTGFTAPLELQPGQYGDVSYAAFFDTPPGQSLALHVFDGTGASATMENIKAGRYFLQFGIHVSAKSARSDATFFKHPLPADAPLWTGQAKTGKVSFQLVPAS